MLPVEKVGSHSTTAVPAIVTPIVAGLKDNRYFVGKATAVFRLELWTQKNRFWLINDLPRVPRRRQQVMEHLDGFGEVVDAPPRLSETLIVLS